MHGGDGVSDACVGIVLFRATPAMVSRVSSYAGLFREVIAHDNGGLSADDGELLRRAGVRLIGDGRNVGVAAALNALASAAAGHRRMLLLDQDGHGTPQLAEGLAEAARDLEARGLPVACVGPAPAGSGSLHKQPSYPSRPGMPGAGPLSAVQYVATSGTLLDLDAFRRVGPFREDFFIDGVEVEWCLRAWASGLGTWAHAGLPFEHRVGEGVIRSRFLGVTMPRQREFRMATYVRNAVYAWRLPHVPLSWKARQVAYLPVQVALYWADSGYRPSVIARLARAFADGATGRLGRPYDAPAA